MKSNKPKFIFFGTPDFSAIILKKLIENNYLPIAVFTALDKPVGRKRILKPSPVKVLAKKNGLLVFQPKKIGDDKLQIEKLKPDLIILSAYGQIIPKEILEIPKYGCLNVHPSLLPKYRGPSPIQTAILNGEEKTGVTIFMMDEKIDHGPIIAQKELEIKKYNFKTLSKKLAELGADLLIEILPKYLANEIKPIPQDDSKATYTKIIKKEDGKINWQKTAEEIERMIRAYYPWPGTYTYIKSQIPSTKSQTQTQKMLKIIKAKVLKIDHQKETGTVFLTEKKEPAIACKKDALILKEVQFEGKKKISGKDLLNGYPWIVNLKLF